MSKKLMQTLKGFRDFLPEEKKQRDYVAEKIIEVFKRFGFEPLETPTLEYASLLLGKYGTEADKLVYSFKDRGEREVALRYDQTVPTARILAQYQNDLPKYFRRYQIQNVFRADKPQKGRYREFTQCDIDIFGATSAISDAEILACAYFAYKNIGFENVEIRINDRQTLLATLSPFATPEVSVFSIVGSIDKLDKQSPAEVIAELVEKGLTESAAKEALTAIEKCPMSSNLSDIVDMAMTLGVDKKALVFNPKLARGLDYYTGIIFEIILPEYAVGSCGGGGRYDELINELGGINIPAVGMAFGFDRTVEAAVSLGLVPTNLSSSQVLVTIFDEDSLFTSLKVAAELRDRGLTTEVYPAIDKLGKQFKYADQKNIPYVLIIGQKELESEKVSLRNMKTGEQTSLALEDVAEFVLS